MTLHLDVVCVLVTVANVFKVRVDWWVRFNKIFHYLIVGSNVRGCDIPIAIEKILKEIAARDCGEAGEFILQYLEVHVFDRVGDMILESLIYFPRIVIYYLS